MPNLGAAPHDWGFAKKKEKEKLRRQLKPLPTVIKKEKEPLYLVLSTVKLLHREKERKNQCGSAMWVWPETGS
jgi:hypothetical protein